MTIKGAPLLKRTRQRGGLLARLFAVTAIVSGLAVGLAGYLAAAESAGLRAELATRTGVDAGFVLTLEPDADPVAQDAAVRDILAERFRIGDRALPVRVDRGMVGVKTVPFASADPVAAAEARPDRVQVEGIADLSDRATLVDGTWATGPAEATVQSDAAALLGVAPGSRILIGSAPVRVTGTWRVDDRFDPCWLGDPFITAGTDGRAVGPVIVGDAEWDDIGADALVQWTITPVLDRLTVDDLDDLVVAWRSVAGAVRGSGAVDGTTVDTGGQLLRALADTRTTVAALHSVQPVTLLILAAIALVALAELARLLAGMRAGENLLLWSRGASVAALTAFSATEAAIVGLAGGAAGAAAAAGMLGVAASRSLDAGSLLGPPVLAALLVAAVFGAATYRASLPFTRRGSGPGSRRVARFGGTGGLVVLGVAAAISVWQLLLYGSPLVPSRGGGQQVDPLAVSAPVLALACLALLGVLVVPLLGPVLHGAARRSPSPGTLLLGSTLTRQRRSTTTPIIVCALALGQLVLAAGYSATWERSFETASELHAGAALSVEQAGAIITADVTTTAASTPGVGAVAAAVLGSTGVGTEAVELVGLSPSGLRSVVTGASGSFDRDAAAEAIAVPQAGIQLDAGARSLEVTMATDGLDRVPAVTAILTDHFGVQQFVPLSAHPEGTLQASLPTRQAADGTGWLITGFEVAVRGEDVLPEVEKAVVSITGASADGVPLDGPGPGWETVQVGSGALLFEPRSTGTGFAILGTGTARILPSQGELIPPVVLTAAVAERNGLEPGDRVTLALDPRADAVPCTVAAVVPVVPGADGDALLIDLGALQALALRAEPTRATPQALWVGAEDPVAARSALIERLPAPLRVEAPAVDPARVMLASAATSLWVGAVGAALVALLAIGSVAGSQVRTRRGELVVLRTLGIRSGRLVGLRRAELSLSITAGLVIGGLAGAVVTILTVPALVRGATPGLHPGYTSPLELAVVPLAASASLFLLSLGVVVLSYGVRIRRQVATVSAREVEQ